MFDTPCRADLPPEEEAIIYDAPTHRSPGMVNHLALLKDKQWKGNGVRLRVTFIDKPVPNLPLRQKIVKAMNTWSEFCNVRFTLVDDLIGPEVRISFTGKIDGVDHPGYWSKVGTDILNADYRHPTMMLTNFEVKSKQSDWYFRRTVPHETGHTLGFMHEHLRPELVDRIDEKKAIEYYGRPPNKWSPTRTKGNVLKPLDMSLYNATAEADVHSIMCYSIDKAILKPGTGGIYGGDEFTKWDKEHSASIYPYRKLPYNLKFDYVSIDKRVTEITACGLSFYKTLDDDGPLLIQTYFEIEGAVPPGRTKLIGELDSPDELEHLIASGNRLIQWRTDGTLLEWTGSYGSETKKWIQIEKNPAIAEVECHAGDIYYRTHKGWVGRYTGTPGDFEKLDQDSNIKSISATDNCLYKTTKSGKIVELELNRPNRSWQVISTYSDTDTIVSTRRHVYQVRNNGQINVYTGIGTHWNLVYNPEQDAGPSQIQAWDDRLFRIENSKDVVGERIVYWNDDNTTKGWRRLDISPSWYSFVYSEGYLYVLDRDEGQVKKYLGIC